MGWKIKDYRDFSVHIYSAGEDGCRANSYIVETTSHLLIIDTQYLLPYAEKVKAMAVRLDKPIARVIITHAHPDHWFGTSVFAGEQIYALPTVRAEMAKDAITAFQRNKPRLGDKIGDEAVLPNYTLEKGNFVVDGVEFYVHEILNTETSSLAVLEIPAEKILFASDLVYAHTHIYVADNHIREWIAALQSCQKKTLGISSPDTEMIFLLRSCWRKWITCAVLARQWPRQNHFLNSGKECWSNIPTMPESSYWSLTRCFCYSLPTAIQKLMLDRAFFLDYNLHIQMIEGRELMNTDESILTKCLFFTSNRLSNILRKKAEDAFKDLGIGVPYVYMLVVVNQYDGITQSELAEKLDIAPSTCTRFVERLVKEGILRKEFEWKTAHIFLTEEGKKVCRGIDKSLLTLHQSYCQPLGEKRALQLIRDIGAACETLSGQE